MELRINKTKSAITLFLLLTMAVTLVAVPLANAHDPPWTISTYSFIAVNPDPVGVGQTVYISYWLDKVPPTAIGYWGMVWHNMEVKVTKPNGDTEILGPFDSDAVGGIWTQYTPDEAGTYKFVGTFPGQTAVLENPYPYTLPFLTALTYAYINDTFTGSTSEEVTLTVQEEAVETAYPANPLPTEYWARPINSMNREWSVIGGNWLGLGDTQFGFTGVYDQNGNFNPYTTAPNSAHVIWTKPIAFGGQIGGEFGSEETSLYATGTAYEAKFGPVILNGILYYTAYPGAGNNPGPLTAVDLRTGETLWTQDTNDLSLRVGMIYNFISGDQYGAHAYLFCAPAAMGFIPYPLTNDWEMYDAMTGEYILSIDNASAGMLVEGPNGEILSYTIEGNMLRLWNSSKCIAVGQGNELGSTNYSPAEIWRPPKGATIDWNDGYEWSAPIATDINGKTISPALAITKISDDVVLLTAVPDLATGGVPGRAHFGWRVDAGYSAVDGSLIWGPVNRTLTPWVNSPIGPAGEGVYTEYTCQDLSWTGYSITTGQKLWGPTPSYNSSWGYYDNNAKGVIGYGNLYVFGLSGEVYAYDVQTGDEVWSWYAGNAGVDTPYGTWPLGTWCDLHVLADGKLYVRAGHDYTPPVFKGAKLYCINATTGEEIWNSLSFNILGGPAVADGIMLWFNGYDNQVYAYGKGASATTVDAPLTAIAEGDSVVIRGTVTDQSPGAMEYTQTARFANGVPAIADEYMSAWMEYLYQQQPLPQDATGVTVKLETLDPNGNFYEIGTVTSDSSGMYKLMWEPPVPGEYTIIATFAGSESYWPSYAETAIGVTEASPTPPPEEPLTLPPTDMYVIGTGIAIIIAIAIVGIIILKKR